MVKHVVMFKLKAEDKAEAPQRAKKELEAMVGKIEGLLSMEVGIDFLPDNPSADMVLIATFPNMEAFDAYGPHPVHRQFLSWFKPMIAIRSCVDYQE